MATSSSSINILKMCSSGSSIHPRHLSASRTATARRACRCPTITSIFREAMKRCCSTLVSPSRYANFFQARYSSTLPKVHDRTADQINIINFCFYRCCPRLGELSVSSGAGCGCASAAEFTYGCPIHSTCENSIGSHRCFCDKGYEAGKTGLQNVLKGDVCKPTLCSPTNISNSVTGVCEGTTGSKCAFICLKGFQKVGEMVCHDDGHFHGGMCINECHTLIMRGDCLKVTRVCVLIAAKYSRVHWKRLCQYYHTRAHLRAQKQQQRFSATSPQLCTLGTD